MRVVIDDHQPRGLPKSVLRAEWARPNQPNPEEKASSMRAPTPRSALGSTVPSCTAISVLILAISAARSSVFYNVSSRALRSRTGGAFGATRASSTGGSAITGQVGPAVSSRLEPMKSATKWSRVIDLILVIVMQACGRLIAWRHDLISEPGNRICPRI